MRTCTRRPLSCSSLSAMRSFIWSVLPASRSGSLYSLGLDASIHVGISERDV